MPACSARFHFHAERLLDPQRHLSRQGRVAVDEVGEGSAAHVEHLRRLAHRQAEFVENFLTGERARMRRGHPYSRGTRSVIGQGSATRRVSSVCAIWPIFNQENSCPPC